MKKTKLIIAGILCVLTSATFAGDLKYAEFRVEIADAKDPNHKQEMTMRSLPGRPALFESGTTYSYVNGCVSQPGKAMPTPLTAETAFDGIKISIQPIRDFNDGTLITLTDITVGKLEGFKNRTVGACYVEIPEMHTNHLKQTIDIQLNRPMDYAVGDKIVKVTFTGYAE